MGKLLLAMAATSLFAIGSWGQATTEVPGTAASSAPQATARPTEGRAKPHHVPHRVARHRRHHRRHTAA